MSSQRGENRVLESKRTTVKTHCGPIKTIYNAAVNILVAGGQPETQNACGADVRQKLETLAFAVCGEARTRRSDLELVA